jgi:hypothetical protein
VRFGVRRDAGVLLVSLPLLLMSLGTCTSLSTTLAMQGGGGLVVQRLSAEGMGWVPTACNLMAMTCFGLAVAVNQEVTGGAEAGEGQVG